PVHRENHIRRSFKQLLDVRFAAARLHLRLTGKRRLENRLVAVSWNAGKVWQTVDDFPAFAERKNEPIQNWNGADGRNFSYLHWQRDLPSGHVDDLALRSRTINGAILSRGAGPSQHGKHDPVPKTCGAESGFDCPDTRRQKFQIRNC